MSRTAYLREAKRKQREKDRLAGSVEITVKLTAEEAALYFAARERQRGPLDGFAQRCLTRGAMFLANSGNPRGKKLRVGSGPMVLRSLPSPDVLATVDRSISTLEVAA